MAKILYKEHRFGASAQLVIGKANAILEEYEEKGFDLTLRQLYYQFVSRGIIQNNIREYKNLGNVINDGRLAGLIDWNHIVDRTRNIRGNNHWTNPANIIASAAYSFRIEKWKTQPFRVEVWIEKDALIGVIEKVCEDLDINYFSCRGYVSQSEIHEAAKDRFIPWEGEGQETVILHLGDHDPSGIDMTRDIQDRLEMFGSRCRVKRIALNMDQVRLYEPPPNPAKLTDSRSTIYVQRFGEESWELDALSPEVIGKLISDEVLDMRSATEWNASCQEERRHRHQLAACSNRWNKKIVPLLEKTDPIPSDDGEEE